MQYSTYLSMMVVTNALTGCVRGGIERVCFSTYLSMMVVTNALTGCDRKSTGSFKHTNRGRDEAAAAISSVPPLPLTPLPLALPLALLLSLPPATPAVRGSIPLTNQHTSCTNAGTWLGQDKRIRLDNG